MRFIFYFFFFQVLKYQIWKRVYALERKSVCASQMFESIMLMHFQSPSLVFSTHLLTQLLCHKCLDLQFDLILNVRRNYTGGYLVSGYFLNLPSLKKMLGVGIFGCIRRQLKVQIWLLYYTKYQGFIT